MSDSADTDRERDALQRIADAFGTTQDPLAAFEEQFTQLDLDPFTPFDENVLQAQDLNDETLRIYRSVFDEWQSFMETQDRHPACPNDSHVGRYIRWQLDSESDGGKDNHPRTVKGKLRKLNRAYGYWQDAAAFPHPQGYNPFELAREQVDLSNPDPKEHRRIPVEELQEMIASVTNIRRRAIIGIQFKLGLRANEVCNIRLCDLSFSNVELRSHYL